MNSSIQEQWGKVPEVTLWFWIIKIAATTLGETGGDAVTMSMKLGYLVGTAIFAVLFVIAVAAQIRARRYHPFLFWGVIVATTTAGTTLADLLDRSLGIGYLGGTTALVLALLGTLFLASFTRLRQRLADCLAQGGDVLLGHDHVLSDPGHGAG